MKILGYFHGVDPAAALVIDGELVAFAEEERLIRFKHANYIFPNRAIEHCLKSAGLRVTDLDCFALGWNLDHYSNGSMAGFYERLNTQYPPDEATRAWQRRNVGMFHVDVQRKKLVSEIVRYFGVVPERVPPLRYFPHHESHAACAFYLSPFEEALVLTIDGSGDQDTTTFEVSIAIRIHMPLV